MRVSLDAIKNRTKLTCSNFFKLNWFESIEYCSRLGMRLSVLNTLEKHTEAVREAQATVRDFSGFHNGLWIGGSDLGKKGSFVWLPTGTKVTWTKWKFGEPSGGANERCMNLYNWHEEEFYWMTNDANCELRFYALCQHDYKV